MDQKINNSNPHIWRLSFNFRFPSRKSQSQQKLAKKITHFAIKFPSKRFILRTSNHSTLRKTYSRNTAKKLTHFTNFPVNMLLIDVRKSNCTASFLEAQELYSRRTWKANACIFLIYIPKENFCSRDVGSFYLVGDWIISLRPLAFLKCFKIFILIEIFWNSTIFQHFDTSINSI